jgi:hypothetical protein
LTNVALAAPEPKGTVASHISTVTVEPAVAAEGFFVGLLHDPSIDMLDIEPARQPT